MSVPTKVVQKLVKRTSKAADEAALAASRAIATTESEAAVIANSKLHSIFEEYEALQIGREQTTKKFGFFKANAEKQAEAQVKIDIIQEKNRMIAISKKETSVSYTHQTRNKEEYQTRWTNQISDPTYSIEATNSRFLDDFDTFQSRKEVIETKFAGWEFDNAKMTPLFRSPEHGTHLQSWAKGTALTRGAVFGDTSPNADLPVVMYHMDTMSDPRMAQEGAIQGTLRANEFGLHVGPAGAANQIAEGRSHIMFVRGIMMDTLKQTEDDIFKITGEQLDLVFELKKSLEISIRNNFLRPGEDRIFNDADKFVDEIIDVAFEDISVRALLNIDKSLQKEFSGSSSLILKTSKRDEVERQLLAVFNSTSSKMFSRRLRRLFVDEYNTSGYPIIANVQNGLLMPDIQYWDYSNIAKELSAMDIFPDRQDELEAIRQMFGHSQRAQGNLALEELIKEEGFDHIVYHNQAEFSGTPSFLFFDPKTYQNLYAPVMGGTRQSGAKAAAFVFSAPLSTLFDEEE